MSEASFSAITTSRSMVPKFASATKIRETRFFAHHSSSANTRSIRGVLSPKLSRAIGRTGPRATTCWR